MESLFVFTGKIVGKLNKIFSTNKEIVKYISFKNAEITNTTFKIVYGNNDITLLILLSINPLDMPWEVVVKVQDLNHNEVFLNEINSLKPQNSPRYEVYPNILKNKDGSEDLLVDKIVGDIYNYLIQIP